MANETLKSKIAEVAASIQVELQEEEVPVIGFYESGDDLVFMETSDDKGLSQDVGRVVKPLKRQGPDGGNKGSGKQGSNTTSGADGEDTEIQEPQGLDEQEGRDDVKLSGEDGEDGKEDGDGSGDGDGGEGDGDDNKIKIGTKVRIKSTGLEGIVSGINDDGTFAVSPVPVPVPVPVPESDDIKENGGALPVIPSISPLVELMRENAAHAGVEILGDFPESELEVISPESKGGKGGKGKGKPGKGKGEKGEGEDAAEGEEGEEGEGEGEEGEGKPGKGKGKGKGKGEKGKGEKGEGEDGENEEGEDGEQRPGQGGQQQGPPPEELNAEALRQRVEQIKNTLLKLPTFAFRFFQERIEQDGELFTMKSSLALMERFARSVFSKKKPMSTSEAKAFLNKTAEQYFELLTYLKLNAIFRDGEYYLDPYATDSNFESLFTDNKLEQVYAYCERVEARLQLDSDYYRFMTLAAFNKPALFGKDYMNVHLDLIFRYFKATILPASNTWSLCFVGSLLDFGKIYESCQDNLDMYTVLRTPDRLDFIVLESTAMLEDISDYKKYLLSELPETNGYLLNCLSGYAMSFYRNALTLRDNYSYSEIVMKNVNFLLSLQSQRFRDVLTEIVLSAS